jgi:hypothetical protein
MFCRQLKEFTALHKKGVIIMKKLLTKMRESIYDGYLRQTLSRSGNFNDEQIQWIIDAVMQRLLREGTK